MIVPVRVIVDEGGAGGEVDQMEWENKSLRISENYFIFGRPLKGAHNDSVNFGD